MGLLRIAWNIEEGGEALVRLNGHPMIQVIEDRVHDRPSASSTREHPGVGDPIPAAIDSQTSEHPGDHYGRSTALSRGGLAERGENELCPRPPRSCCTGSRPMTWSGTGTPRSNIRRRFGTLSAPTCR